MDSKSHARILCGYKLEASLNPKDLGYFAGIRKARLTRSGLGGIFCLRVPRIIRRKSAKYLRVYASSEERLVVISARTT